MPLKKRRWLNMKNGECQNDENKIEIFLFSRLHHRNNWLWGAFGAGI